MRQFEPLPHLLFRLIGSLQRKQILSIAPYLAKVIEANSLPFPLYPAKARQNSKKLELEANLKHFHFLDWSGIWLFGDRRGFFHINSGQFGCLEQKIFKGLGTLYCILFKLWKNFDGRKKSV